VCRAAANSGADELGRGQPSQAVLRALPAQRKSGSNAGKQQENRPSQRQVNQQLPSFDRQFPRVCPPASPTPTATEPGSARREGPRLHRPALDDEETARGEQADDGDRQAFRAAGLDGSGRGDEGRLTRPTPPLLAAGGSGRADDWREQLFRVFGTRRGVEGQASRRRWRARRQEVGRSMSDGTDRRNGMRSQ